MRLIGGNISDTPVKEIGDGSAFNVGGAAGIPEFVSLGTWSSVAAISATNWSQCALSSALIHGGIYFPPTQLTRMSATSLLRSWVETSSGDCMVGEIVLNADGTVASVATANDLSSDLSSQLTQFIIRKVPGSSTRIVISRPSRASPLSHKFATYDLSSGSLSLHGAVITKAATADSASCAVIGMEMTLVDSDYGIIFGKDRAINHDSALGIKFTTGGGGQEFGAVHDSPEIFAGNGSVAGPAWLSTETANRVYAKLGTQSERWDLTASDPPAVADTLLTAGGVKYISGGSPGGGFHWSVWKRDHILFQPQDDPDDGSVTAYCTVQEAAGAHNLRFVFVNVPNETVHYSGGFADLATAGGGPITGQANHIDHTLVQVDTVGDWHRCVAVGVNDTTGLYALPVNVNPGAELIHYGTISYTTNLTPHNNNGNGLDASFNGSNILIVCEDTAAAPSTITLPVTV